MSTEPVKLNMTPFVVEVECDCRAGKHRSKSYISEEYAKKIAEFEAQRCKEYRALVVATREIVNEDKEADRDARQIADGVLGTFA